MKNICTICLLLAAASWLSAQCNSDTQPPFLQPNNNTVVTLGGPKCTATVNAEQLLLAYSDNCTPATSLTLRLRRVGASTGFPMLPSNVLTLTPADVATPVFVEIWARDAAGNTAFVYAGLTVQNPGGCTFAFLPDTIRGGVGLPNGGLEDITWVEEVVSPQGNVTYFSTNTHIKLPENLFDGPAQDDIIRVTPEQDNNPLNGVSTYDLVLTTEFILGLTPFDNPYKYLAADADRNNRITLGDIIEFRRLILGLYAELPNNTSWRFVPDDYIFPKPGNPFYEFIPESITFDRFRNKPLPDFIPIKVGDVNSNAVLNSLLESDDRSTVQLELPDVQLPQGQTVLVPVTLADIPDLRGLQCAFGFDPSKIEIAGIQAAALTDFSNDHFYQPEPGILNLSWNKLETATIDTRKPLFFLEIKALQNCQLKKTLRLKTTRLAAEAYAQSGGITNLELAYRDLPTPSADEILLPYPNPAVDGFTVPIRLAESGQVMLELFEPSGRRVFELEKHFDAGEHFLETPNLPAGLYVYRVWAGTAFLEGKVVFR